MSSHLLAITIGPVQGFIKAARRTRDLWMGSHILSEISKAVAKHLRDECAATLIFPGVKPENETDLDPQSDFNAVNVVLCELPETHQPKDVAASAKAAAIARWREFAQSAFKYSEEDVDKTLWEEQLGADDVVEFYAAWLPMPSDVAYSKTAYSKTRKQLMRILAGRKACRDFIPANGKAGLPKSSLDGARESVLRRLSKDERDVAKNRRRGGRSKLWARLGEELDIVGLTKRAEYDHDGVRYLSVSRIAADPWLRAVQDKAKTDNANAVREAFNKIKSSCEKLYGMNALTRRHTQEDFRKFPFVEDFPYEGVVIYRNCYREIYDCPCPQNGQSDQFDKDRGKALKDLADNVKWLETEGKFRTPNSYFAVLAADGDRIGKVLSQIPDMATHQLFSASESAFAKKVHEIVRDHNGATVYAGGEDVLAFLPLDRCLTCARMLYKEFDSMVARKLPENIQSELRNRCSMPTLSVGIAIGHFLDPLEDLLTYAHAAERKAKDPLPGQDDRNGLAVFVHPRSGVPFGVRDNWTPNEAGSSPLDCRLGTWAKLLDERRLSKRTAYHLRQLARGYQHWPTDRDEDKASLTEAIRLDARRMLKRKSENPPEELLNQVDKLTSAADLYHLADEIIVAMRLTATVEAGA